MMTNALLSFFIAPVLAIILLIYINLRFKVGTNKLMIRAILFGIISVLLVLIAQWIAEALGLTELRNIKRTAFYTFVVIGFSAELGKFLFLRYYFLPLKGFSGPLDGIIYSLLISLGFATSATILVSYKFFGAGIDTLFIYTYSIANVIFAIIMGFFVGLGRARQNRFIDSMTGLAAAAFLHGLFNFSFLTDDIRLLILFGIGSVVLVILLIAKAVNIKAVDRKLNNT